jgi:hypothetical protein
MCGGGTRMRTRTVTRPASNGGMECPALSESQACNTDPCPECQSGQKACADMDSRRECVDGSWRTVDCGGETPVCTDGDCVAAPPPTTPPP